MVVLFSVLMGWMLWVVVRVFVVMFMGVFLWWVVLFI